MTVIQFKQKQKLLNLNLYPVTVCVSELADAIIAVAFLEQDRSTARKMCDLFSASLSSGTKFVEIRDPQILAYRRYLDISSEGAGEAFHEMYRCVHQMALP
jgi:hypothetical protein